MNCKNCRQNCTWAGKERSEHGKCFVGYIPTTNADRIRSMTDEELAEYLDGVCHDLWQMFVADPQKMWLEWLKEEVKHDGN